MPTAPPTTADSGSTITQNHLEFDVSLYLTNSVIRDDIGQPMIDVHEDRIRNDGRLRLEFGHSLGGCFRLYVTFKQAMALHEKLGAVITQHLMEDQEQFGG